MKVPGYQQQVQPEATPNYRATAVGSAEAFGGNVGTALTNLGETAAAIGLREKHKEDTQAVLDASNAMSMDLLNFFNGENGLFASKGVNAKGSASKAEQFFNDTFNKYASQMKNDDQIRTFQAHMRPNVYSYMRDAATHERIETAAALKDSYKANSLTNIDGVGASWPNVDTMKTFLAKNDQLADSQGVSDGWTKDVADFEKNRLRTLGLNKAVVNAMKAGKYDIASNLLDTFKGMMDESVHADLSSQVQKEVIRVDNDALAEDAVKRATRQDGSVDRALAYTLGVKAIGKLAGQAGTSPAWGTIKAIGEKYLGQSYQWGGTSPETGFDCSGFTQHVFRNAGVNLPRLANDQFEYLHQQGRAFTDASQLKPGDLVFSNTHTSQEFDSDNPRHITHVGIYAGNGQVLQDGSSGVKYIDIGGMGDIVGYGSAEGGNVSATWTQQRIDAFKSKIDSKIADAHRLKAEQDQQYHHELYQAIEAAPTLDEAEKIIEKSTLPFMTKHSLKQSIRQSFADLAGPQDSERWMWAHYEKSGLYTDLKGIQQFNDRLAQGNTGDIKEEEWNKYNQQLDMVNKYWSFASGGAYVPGVGVVKQRPSGDSTNMGEMRQQDVDPVSAWIQRARRANIPAETIKALLRKQYGDKYDSEVW